MAPYFDSPCLILAKYNYRKKFFSLSPSKLNLPHVLQVCEAVTPYRDAGALNVFFGECKARGLASSAAYTLYLTGKAPDGSPVPRSDYMERADTLEELRSEWLKTWGQTQS